MGPRESKPFNVSKTFEGTKLNAGKPQISSQKFVQATMKNLDALPPLFTLLVKTFKAQPQQKMLEYKDFTNTKVSKFVINHDLPKVVTMNKKLA